MEITGAFISKIIDMNIDKNVPITFGPEYLRGTYELNQDSVDKKKINFNISSENTINIVGDLKSISLELTLIQKSKLLSELKNRLEDIISTDVEDDQEKYQDDTINNLETDISILEGNYIRPKRR